MHNEGVAASIGRFWRRTYASDYVALIILVVLYVLAQTMMEPFHRMFFLDNIAIQYPHAEVERVNIYWLFIYALGVPMVVILVWNGALSRSAHKLRVSTLGLAISFVLTALITDVIKNAVGRPRPDLIARCKPRKGTPAHELVTYLVCTETNHHTLQDGWRSFPSGHSSSSFAGLGFLSLFIAGQLHVFRPRTDLAKALLALIPLLGAALIAISRCMDYRHDVYDVTTGSILGFVVALFSYKRYYPSLTKRDCHVPHPAPAELELSGLKRKGRDEEELANVQAFEVGDDEESDDVRSEPERVPLASVGRA